MDIVIYHNPDCGTSRNALALIRHAGVEPHVVEYLKTPAFEHHGHPKRVEIDMTEAHLWDLTGVAAVDKVVFRYRRQGAELEVIGMTQAGRKLIDRVGKHDKEPSSD